MEPLGTGGPGMKSYCGNLILKAELSLRRQWNFDAVVVRLVVASKKNPRSLGEGEKRRARKETGAGLLFGLGHVRGEGPVGDEETAHVGAADSVEDASFVLCGGRVRLWRLRASARRYGNARARSGRLEPEPARFQAHHGGRFSL